MEFDLYSRYGIQVQELLAVKHGIKSVLRTSLNSEHLKELEAICRKDGLFSSMKTFNRIYNSDLDSPLKIVYISSSKEHIRNAYLSEKSGDRKSLGKLLGYPECCVEFFIEALEDKKLPYPIKTYLKTEGRPSFLTNNIFKMESRLDSEGLEILNKNHDFASRISHIFLISHIPCSYNCKESIKTGRKILNLLKKNNPGLAKEVVSALKKPLIFFDDFNWVIFDGTVKGNIINYTSVLPPLSLIPGDTIKKFREGNKVIKEKNSVNILRGGKVIEKIEKKSEYNGIILDFS